MLWPITRVAEESSRPKGRAKASDRIDFFFSGLKKKKFWVQNRVQFLLSGKIMTDVAVYGIPGIHGLRYTSTACYTGHR